MTRQKGPVEILCEEIDFRFERSMERHDIFVSFVSMLVRQVSEMREMQERIADLTKKSPSPDSAEVLIRAQALLAIRDRKKMVEASAGLHNFIHEVAPEDAYPCDHLIDMLSSCVSAIRFGLETPCHSRHAAEAASHIWRLRYGLTLEDRYTSEWRKDWTRTLLQLAILALVPVAVPIEPAMTAKPDMQTTDKP
jgi:hypothetical protein